LGQTFVCYVPRLGKLKTLNVKVNTLKNEILLQVIAKKKHVKSNNEIKMNV